MKKFNRQLSEALGAGELSRHVEVRSVDGVFAERIVAPAEQRSDVGNRARREPVERDGPVVASASRLHRSEPIRRTAVTELASIVVTPAPYQPFGVEPTRVIARGRDADPCGFVDLGVCRISIRSGGGDYPHLTSSVCRENSTVVNARDHAGSC